MKATEILKGEHRVIEQVLDCLEKMTQASERSGRLEAEPARDALAFFRGFADRCHHGKEEAQLFPLMEARGFSPHQGPTAVMRQEHEQGRDLLRRIEKAIPGAAEGQAAGVRAFGEAARAYIKMLREHIDKEDHCLFPMAEQTLSSEDARALVEKFERVEHEEIGHGEHERFLGIAGELARRYGVPDATAAHGGHGCCGGH